MKEKIKFGHYVVELSNTNKVMFPDEGITKGEVIEYYNKISEVMIPHLKDRPLTMHRFPDGIGGKDFYQKDLPDYFPEWIRHIKIKTDDGTISQMVCNNSASLVYIADQACITPHIWLSREDKLDYPDRIIFDFDPSDDNFGRVRNAVFSMRDLLERLELECFVMTTGSRGCHVIVPLDRNSDFDSVRNFAKQVSETLADKHPDEFTTEQRKKKRGNRVFIDYLRNAYAQTGVAPYAIRSKPGAPIAAPIEWSELNNNDMNPQRYNIRNIFRRLGQKDDPWKSIEKKAQSLKRPRQILDSLVS